MSSTIATPARLSTWRTALLLAAFLAAAAFRIDAQSSVPAGDAAPALEQRVKAAFLYKFAGFIEWPGESFGQPQSPFTFTVVDEERLAQALEEVVAGRKLEGRNIQVRRVKSGEAPGETQILFIGRSRAAQLNRTIAEIKPRPPVLIVTDAEGAIAQGSVINFALAEGKVRFEVSLDAAEKRGLKLSSRLLAVAQQVHGGTP